MNPGRASRRRAAGFTLVELMATVTIVGVLAAVSVPSFVEHVREAKLSEVPINLGRCHRGVLEYFHSARGADDGSSSGSQLPTQARRILCPAGNGGGFGNLFDLDGSANYVDPAVYDRPGGRTYRDIGLVLSEPIHACYYFYHNYSPWAGLRDSTWYRCLAFTDVDDDNMFSIWFKTAFYRPEAGDFATGAVWHYPHGDDW